LSSPGNNNTSPYEQFITSPYERQQQQQQHHQKLDEDDDDDNDERLIQSSISYIPRLNSSSNH
jgi:hypothetical protein